MSQLLDESLYPDMSPKKSPSLLNSNLVKWGHFSNSSLYSNHLTPPPIFGDSDGFVVISVTRKAKESARDLVVGAGLEFGAGWGMFYTWKW